MIPVDVDYIRNRHSTTGKKVTAQKSGFHHNQDNWLHFYIFKKETCSFLLVQRTEGLEMKKNDSVDTQFIFRETEFEDEAFHAASFVAKYRRVSSLESLKEQLLIYSNALKQQLYDIINRDYKDFITISTKVRFVRFPKFSELN